MPLDVVAVAGGGDAAGGNSNWLQRLTTPRVFSRTGLAVWTRQVAGLVAAGLPLERALTAAHSTGSGAGGEAAAAPGGVGTSAAAPPPPPPTH